MDILVKELRIRRENFLAIGTDPDYMPVYRRFALGYTGTDMIWWSLTRFVPMTDISEGETETMAPKAILAKYGALWDDAPRPDRLSDERTLPLYGRDGKQKV